ncbi:hypothetical protein [Nonomuraea sp. LPB2021202275-12-8]|uniref:hypothetical protein n=1 Tax=Nonomuraea sp. LPB2021202275-12-8 TaxID=3120159 RepID=UPI00300D65CF
MTGSDQSTVDTSKALANAFMKANPTIKINMEHQLGGSEGDNVVKTRLSTGEMTDVFWYNSGSLLQALNPAQTLVDLTENLDAAKKFLAFVASSAGTEAVTAAVRPAGPYRIKGSKLPDDAIQVAKDLQAYLDKGATSPALEFLSPIKGPSLEQITVAVGSGLTRPAEGAAQYDKDVEKQAKQLGLAGW